MSEKNFFGRAASSIGPAISMAAVTPNDDADLPEGPTRSLFVGGAGEIHVHDLRGVSVILASGDAQYHPVIVRRVCATGTTATGIVALY